MGISFSSVMERCEVHGYIPQLRGEAGFSYPLLACDISQVDPKLIGWKDPFHDYDYHNLASDARDIVGYYNCRQKQNVAFSQVRHWPVQVRSASRNDS